MPISFRCSRATLLGLALAAAPALHAQAQSEARPRFQVDFSVDHTGSASMYSVIADGPTSFSRSQQEDVNVSGGISGLIPLGGRASLRVGLSLADKGIVERTESMGETTTHDVGIVYLGAPIAVGYNLVNPRRGFVPFLEAGVLPELLLSEEASEFEYDLRSSGVSYLVSFGVKYNFGAGRALVIAPELRHHLTEYSRVGPGTYEFSPSVVGLKLGFQF